MSAVVAENDLAYYEELASSQTLENESEGDTIPETPPSGQAAVTAPPDDEYDTYAARFVDESGHCFFCTFPATRTITAGQHRHGNYCKCDWIKRSGVARSYYEEGRFHEF